MPKFVFNPVSVLLNLALGWLLMSFLQAGLRVLIAGSRGELIQRFKAIAFFHDRPAALVNITIMAAIWVVTTGIWVMVRQK